MDARLISHRLIRSYLAAHRHLCEPLECRLLLAATLIEHVRRELGPIATPSSLEFVSSLPKTRSGKILRRFLKAKEQGVDAGDVSTMEG